MEHGGPLSKVRHVGDLGNIISTNSLGSTHISITDSKISLQSGNACNIFGRSLVIHKNADTFSGISGNAGARIACGVIEKRKTAPFWYNQTSISYDVFLLK